MSSGFSVFIISQGLLWGNIVGIGIVLIQQYTGIIHLDPRTYYVSEAPMELNLTLIARWAVSATHGSVSHHS